MPTPAALDAAINPGQKSLPYSFRLFHTQGERAQQQGGKSQYWRRASIEIQVFEQESDAHVEGTAEFSLCHLTATPHGNPANKNWEKRKKGSLCTWLPIPEDWSYPSGMNLPGRQSDNSNEVQLKSLRALKRKINFVTMHNTYSDVSGTVIQGENQLSGTEGWGKSGATPPKALELHLHKTVTGEGSTRPWEPTNRVWRQGIAGHKSGSNLIPKGQQGNLGQRGHGGMKLMQAKRQTSKITI